MADKPQPLQPPTPPARRPPEGAPAPPVTGVPTDPELRSAKVVRSGAIVLAVLWEE